MGEPAELLLLLALPGVECGVSDSIDAGDTLSGVAIETEHDSSAEAIPDEADCDCRVASICGDDLLLLSSRSATMSLIL